VNSARAKAVVLKRGVRLSRGASIKFQGKGTRALTRSKTWKVFERKVFRPIDLFKVRRGLNQTITTQARRGKESLRTIALEYERYTHTLNICSLLDEKNEKASDKLFHEIGFIKYIKIISVCKCKTFSLCKYTSFSLR